MKSIENISFLRTILDQETSFLSAGHWDYIHSLERMPTNYFEWLRRYLHLYADVIAPNRHQIFSTPQTLNLVDERDLPDVGVLPIETPLYSMLLKQQCFCQEEAALDEVETYHQIEQALFHALSGKIVYLLPGRGGQIAQFLLDFDVSKLVTCTDDRYWSHFHMHTHDQEGGRLYVDNSRLHQFLPKIIGLSSQYPPDLIISTNMFNSSRYSGEIAKHQMEVEWQELLDMFLAIMKPNHTRLFLTPALDHTPCFTHEELLAFVGTRGVVDVFQAEELRNESEDPMAADYTFCITAS